MFRKRDTHIHFVGIGGIGMSGIAEVLLNLGYRVTGTDLADSETTRRLAAMGATIHRGHDAAHLGDADVVVTSSAIRPGNPEVAAARAQQIPVIPRAEMLAELMRLKQGIAIAGSHGKTTTTSLVATALHAAGLDPTVVIGGKLNALGSNARLGASDLMVVEADESDGSFLMLSPMVAVITNIDDEHLDHYATSERLDEAFLGFANRVPFYGLAVVCADDPRLARLIPRLHKRFVTYGFGEGNDYVATEVRHDGPNTHFKVRARGRDLGDFVVHMPGIHNVLNALATIAVADFLTIEPALTRRALAEFHGVQRRFTVRGEGRGVLVVDDYGHHPTEIEATLRGARTGYAERRLIAAFQPHRYTRTRDHLEAFAASLDQADVVVLTEIYAAGEPPIDGITVDRLAALTRARRPDRPVYVERELAGVGDLLERLSSAGDLVITLGAGSITRVSFDLADRLGGGASLRA
ncbi:MAG: UDP-N-acetylmuramate--L-alanine ligase [Myxococcales bacterium]|nr:UDP-N-acetylmuramate--L-alanine ligase [Myxococcales bacterium]